MTKPADAPNLDLPRQHANSRFCIKAPLGWGAVATVWRAVDTVTGREVAIKLVRTRMARVEDIRRLAREVMVLRKLDHPCIVGLVDTGVTEAGAPYLVLDLVDGVTLRHRMNDGPMPAEDVVDVVNQICSALEEAHAHGVAHLDVKPENVLLEAPEHLSVKLVDFGMARMLRRRCLTITGANTICGTPQYMSPERAEGRPTGGAADVYAVAIMAYEMLTGQRPFEGDNPVEVLVRHIQETPDLSGVGPEVQQVLLRGLSKDPEHRPSARQLARDLARALLGDEGEDLRDAA